MDIERDGISANLFDNAGGGPNGSEWNPATDLYLVACLPDSLSMPVLELKLNRKAAPGIGFTVSYPVSAKGTFISFVIPFETWDKKQRRIHQSR